MYQKSVLTLIIAINSKNVKRNGSWTEEEGQLITRMEALVAIKLVGTKFQVRVVATKDLDRVDVAHHQSAEEGGEDDGGFTPSRSWSSCAFHLHGDNWAPFSYLTLYCLVFNKSSGP